MSKSNKFYIGLGKTKYNSSVCAIDETTNEIQIWLTERLNRKKASGAWPLEGIESVEKILNRHESKLEIMIAENRDVQSPEFFENFCDVKFPFYDHLKKKKIEKYSKKFNPLLTTENHHEAHAYAALAMSPFEQSLIVVMDGAGNALQDQSELLEECSVFTQNGGKLELVHKRSTKIIKSLNDSRHYYSNGIGLFYEKISDYIFNDSNSSGKVMGLAPFGVATQIKDRIHFQENLQWSKSFKGKTKVEWESSENLQRYYNLAASVQHEFEKDFDGLIEKIRSDFPSYKNIILTGGCALNCTNNARLLEKKIFEKIYVLPFPGDESISFGIANILRLKNNPENWKSLSFTNQSAYLGPIASVLSASEIELKLIQNKISYLKHGNVVERAVNELKNGKIIGWFQGRSESGPRALGNRSILARPDRADLKNVLNSSIKFRESFRPYGCSVIHEKAQDYFQVEENFDAPYMSFAVKLKSKYKILLKEVSHVDGSSRIQTVRPGQNELFYQLIKQFGDQSNLYCLLNTSLNIMGEPIVETVDDAIRFFQSTPVDSMYIGNFELLRK